MKDSIRPKPYSLSDPPLLIPEFAALGRAELPMTEFARHQIGLGATGSGKTESFVRPLTRAILKYPEPAAIEIARLKAPNAKFDPEALRFAALIIDPKSELLETACKHSEEVHKRRTFIFGPGKGLFVSLFEGEAIESMAASQIVDRFLSLSDYAEREARGRDPFWFQSAQMILRDFIEIDRILEKIYPGGIAAFWNALRASATEASILAHSDEIPPYAPSRYLSTHQLMMTVASRHAGSRNVMIHLFCEQLREAGIPANLYANIETLSNLAENTATSMIVVFQSLLGNLLDPSLTNCIWINPHTAPPPELTISVNDVISRGDVIVYSPVGGFRETNVDETIGRALKTLFFRFTLQGKPPERGVAYIADEAQRFLTSSAKSSEAHFLDVGRAYRAGAVLATQSTASLLYRLTQQQGGEDLAHAVLNIILANCGTKLFFRSTETTTNNTLTTLLPNPDHRNWPHICDIRGIASLQVGEAFFLRADGHWGRVKIRL